MTDYERGYADGREAAAKVAENGKEVPNGADDGWSTIMVDMSGDEAAAAIRALPVPQGGEVDGDTAESLRDVIRQIGAINDLDGYNPEIDLLVERALRARSQP